jgi:hypothetical protein
MTLSSSSEQNPLEWESITLKIKGIVEDRDRMAKAISVATQRLRIMSYSLRRPDVSLDRLIRDLQEAIGEGIDEGAGECR